MSEQTWVETITASRLDGPTLTAVGPATCLPPENRIVLQPGFFNKLYKSIRIHMWGRISCVANTPGTARFDFRMGPTGTIVVFDSLAMPLNIVAKSNVGWHLVVKLMCRSVGNGTLATLIGQGAFQSEALIGSPLATVGGVGTCLLPFNVPPVPGGGFDSTISNVFDILFTQTVATGSMTVHEYTLESMN